MWFPSESKVRRSFEELIASHEQLDERMTRLQTILDQAKAEGVDDPALQDHMSDVQLRILKSKNELLKARLAIQFGAASWRGVVPLLTAMKTLVRSMEKHVAALEHGAADGQRRFERDFPSR